MHINFFQRFLHAFGSRGDKDHKITEILKFYRKCQAYFRRVCENAQVLKRWNSPKDTSFCLTSDREAKDDATNMKNAAVGIAKV